MATREVKMLGEVCPRCMTARHPAPVCDHDSTAACKSCGLPKGYLTKEMDPAGPCWFCLTGRPRVAEPVKRCVSVDEFEL
jgi:hypothetical protein